MPEKSRYGANATGAGKQKPGLNCAEHEKTIGQLGTEDMAQAKAPQSQDHQLHDDEKQKASAIT